MVECAMCLLILLHRLRADAPLVAAANRDERLDRPAKPMALLRRDPPAVLGGRDELAGGTWLAVNERGVLAALTNVRSPAGRDPSKRSRGELPLFLAAFDTARQAVDALSRRFDPRQYNPAWLFVADLEELFYVDFSGPPPVSVRALPPGLYALENAPLDAPSTKAAEARAAAAPAADCPPERLEPLLQSILRRHENPAACVHGAGYGTRSSTLVVARAGTLPRVLYSEGPPCVSPFLDAAPFWP